RHSGHVLHAHSIVDAPPASRAGMVQPRYRQHRAGADPGRAPGRGHLRGIRVLRERWRILGPPVSPCDYLFYRARHATTVFGAVSVSFAMRAFATPSAASSTMRARLAAEAGRVDDRVQLSSTARSPSRKANGGAGRFAMPHRLRPNHSTTYDTRH